jgi:hypothetical protein
MEVVEIEVVKRVGGRTAVEGKAAAGVELGPGIEVVEVKVAMEVSGTAIEIEDISKTGATDAVLLAKGLSVWVLSTL